jgi:hypothetical protein
VKKYWVSWYDERWMGAFELWSPWWISGFRIEDEASTVVAAVRGMDEEEVRERVYAAYDNRPEGIEWRFIEEQDVDWDPLDNSSGRWPVKGWMRDAWNGVSLEDWKRKQEV